MADDDSEDARGGASLWLDGVPLVGERRLADDEVAALSARIETARVRLRRDAIAGTIAAAVVIGVPVAFAVANRGDQELSLTILAAVGVMILAIPAVGALYGLLLPTVAWHRWMLVVAIACVAISGLVTDDPEDTWLAIPFFGGVSVVFFGGVAHLWIRIRFHGSIAPRFARVAVDLDARRVLIFRAPESEDAPPIEIELLAASSLLWRVGGERVEAWDFAQPVRIASPSGDSENLHPDDVPPPLRVDGVVYRRRRLNAEERAELGHYVARRPRVIVGDVFGVALVATVIARVIQWIFEGAWSSELSLASWIAVALLALGRAALRIRDLLRLRADLRGGEVVWAKFPGPTEEDRDFDVELLPRSNVPWTHDARPAEWRVLGRG